MNNPATHDISNVIDNQKKLYFARFSERAAELGHGLNEPQLEILRSAFGYSDFIADQLIAKPQWVEVIFNSNTFDFTKLNNIEDYLAKQLADCTDETQLHKVLRDCRNQAMIAIAIADLCKNVDAEISLANISALADTLICGALGWLTKFCRNLWGQPQDGNGNEQPLLVYGMGKLGGQELNYSSDIDLIFAFPENGETVGGRRALDNQQFFTRLGQKLITALNQVTTDGFVYRVDMRLRPFGESGPLVLNFTAMENYYQEQGRDWERYAMLKARLIGNSEYHEQLNNLLRPFVYRRYIDFSVIESFRHMKQMIAQEARRRKLQYNIKLGVGGIREIEFIVQVFQLIRGGRERELQQRNLLKALKLLVEYECVSAESATKLRSAYLFLRRSENAIQAFKDQQTQQLPDEKIDQARLVQLFGLSDWSEYLDLCQQHMRAVNQEFKSLIGEDNEQGTSVDQHWITYWHANWDEDEATHWIEQRQSDWQSQQIHSQISSFKHDLLKRSIGNRGRLILDKLIPLLLELLTSEENVHILLPRVLDILLKIATRTAYLELLYENLGAFKQLLKLCGRSVWISEHLAKFPILLDELIDPNVLFAIADLGDYKLHIQDALMRIPEDDLEAQMEGLRLFKKARQLKIAAADISGVLPVMEVSDHLTALAEATIEEVVNMAWHQMVQRYGQPEYTVGSDDKGFGVIGYGKLGGIELGYGSDLDLVFVHRCPSDNYTNGEKQIPSTQFYLKMAQRILHLFNTRTPNGILYEADMRLRPSGNSGLMVVHIDTFNHYQQTDAWTWEHQALVRARFVYGDQSLADRFTEIRKNILASEREQPLLAADVIKMREKMRGHLDQSSEDIIDVKQSLGGLADIEFLAQYLVLNYSHQYPDLTEYSDNVRVFEALAKAKLISEDEEKLLVDSYCELRNKGHEQVLQDLPTKIAADQSLDFRQQVQKIYQKYLQT